MLTVENLNKTYISQGSQTPALVDINLRIAEGEFICLLGPSGCGKSTLLKIIAGLIPATSGRIAINGKAVSGPGPERAVVFQDYALFPWMTVRDNIEFGLEARKLPVAQRCEISSRLLKVVGLSDFAERFPHQLSGGMKEAIYLSDRIAVMTARPGRVKQIVMVPELRPRDMASVDMNQRQREVRAVLGEEIARAAALEEADLMAGA